MGENKVILSIVTPVYNRAELLKDCYDSLLAQTDRSFEWIIVDDGSSDDTWEVANGFRADFPIVCVRKENGGKHTALNASHPYISGEYVLMLDSDDTLVTTAVEEVLYGWARFTSCQEVAMVTFLKGETAELPNAYAKDECVPVDIIRYQRVRVRSSDCCEVIRAELFKKYPFPVFEGERFVSEVALWNRVGFTHKCVYINKVIYLCEYLEDGLTKSGRAMRIRNPLGGMYTSNLNMNKRNFLKLRIKNGLLYTCYGFFAGLSVKQILTRDSDYFWIKAICLLPGYGLYRKWKRKYLQVA